MADSQSLRSRRCRLHKAGNHTLCRADCGGVPRVAVQVGEVPGEVDPAAAMVRLAALLMAACEANPADAALARELRLTLQALEPVEVVDGELVELLDAVRG
jgi:hypothetical protein